MSVTNGSCDCVWNMHLACWKCKTANHVLQSTYRWQAVFVEYLHFLLSYKSGLSHCTPSTLHTPKLHRSSKHVDNVVVLAAVVPGGSAPSARAAGRASPPPRWCGARSRTSTTCAASRARRARGRSTLATSSTWWRTGSWSASRTTKRLGQKVRAVQNVLTLVS